jgi:hypothetical protein
MTNLQVRTVRDFNKYEDYLYDKYVAEKLGEAELEASAPDAKWTDYKETLRRLKEKYNGV